MSEIPLHPCPRCGQREVCVCTFMIIFATAALSDGVSAPADSPFFVLQKLIPAQIRQLIANMKNKLTNLCGN